MADSGGSGAQPPERVFFRTSRMKEVSEGVFEVVEKEIKVSEDKIRAAVKLLKLPETKASEGTSPAASVSKKGFKRPRMLRPGEGETQEVHVSKGSAVDPAPETLSSTTTREAEGSQGRMPLHGKQKNDPRSPSRYNTRCAGARRVRLDEHLTCNSGGATCATEDEPSLPDRRSKCAAQDELTRQEESHATSDQILPLQRVGHCHSGVGAGGAAAATQPATPIDSGGSGAQPPERVFFRTSRMKEVSEGVFEVVEKEIKVSEDKIRAAVKLLALPETKASDGTSPAASVSKKGFKRPRMIGPQPTETSREHSVAAPAPATAIATRPATGSQPSTKRETGSSQGSTCTPDTLKNDVPTNVNEASAQMMMFSSPADSDLSLHDDTSVPEPLHLWPPESPQRNHAPEDAEAVGSSVAFQELSAASGQSEQQRSKACPHSGETPAQDSSSQRRPLRTPSTQPKPHESMCTQYGSSAETDSDLHPGPHGAGMGGHGWVSASEPPLDGSQIRRAVRLQLGDDDSIPFADSHQSLGNTAATRAGGGGWGVTADRPGGLVQTGWDVARRSESIGGPSDTTLGSMAPSDLAPLVPQSRPTAHKTTHLQTAQSLQNSNTLRLQSRTQQNHGHHQHQHSPIPHNSTALHPPARVRGSEVREEISDGPARPYSSGTGSTGAGDSSLSQTDSDFFDLPLECVRIFREDRGITAPFAWQKECLALPGLKKRKNLVYSLPTSAGKTFVAEVLLLRRMHMGDKKCKAILVQPYVSLAKEKTAALKPFGEAMGFAVESFVNYQGKLPLPKRSKHLCVATIERAERILTTLLDDARIDDLKLVVVDEVHFVGDPERGPVLEVLLARIRTFFPRTQIVCMSATIPNLKDFATWLSADLYESKHRPVELQIMVKCGSRLMSESGDMLKELPASTESSLNLPEHLYMLVSEISAEGGVIVFGATKPSCENLASSLAKAIKAKMEAEQREFDEELLAKRAGVLELIKERGVTCSKHQTASILAGVAFHHASISSEEREEIEDAFRKRIINVLVATSTLAAGVNLPVRRVIIREPYMGIQFLSADKLVQMAGRAGRSGYDKKGECIVIAENKVIPQKARESYKDRGLPSNELERVFALLSRGVPPCTSKLARPVRHDGDTSTDKTVRQDGQRPADKADAGTDEDKDANAPESNVFLRAVLGFVCAATQLQRLQQMQDTNLPAAAASACVTLQSIESFMANTLCAVQQEGGSAVFRPRVMRVLEWLCRQGFMLQISPSGSEPVHEFAPTPLGTACYHSALSPKDAKILFDDMDRMRTEGCVLKDPLHLLFLLVSKDHAHEPVWDNFLTQEGRFNETRRRIAARVGVTTAYITGRRNNRAAGKDSRGVAQERCAKRLFNALLLCDLINEVPPDAVVQKWCSTMPGDPSPKIGRGDLEKLQEDSCTYAHVVYYFALNMGFEDLAAIISILIKRIANGANADVLPLCEIPYVKATRARALLKAGYRTVRDVALAEPEEVARRIPQALGKKPLEVARRVVRCAKDLHNQSIEERKRALEEDMLDAASDVEGDSQPSGAAQGDSTPPHG